jgi:hypothetical protein
MKWIVRTFAFIMALFSGVSIALFLDGSERPDKDLMPFSSWNCVHSSFRTEDELMFDRVAFERGQQLDDPYLRLTIYNATPCYVYYGAVYQPGSFINFGINGTTAGRPTRVGEGIESVAIPPYGSSEIELTPFEFPFRPGIYDFVTAEIHLKFEDEDTPRILAPPPFIVPNDFRLKIPTQ